MSSAIYAGSFDPPTNGHLWAIEEGAKLFTPLIIAIGVNPDKKYAFSIPERIAMLEEMVADISGDFRIESFENQYLADYAKSIEADYILRGIRNTGDYEFERGMRNINQDLQPGITTIFLMPPRELAEISSSLVKGLIGPEGWKEVVKKYVPLSVYRHIEQHA